MKKKYEIIITVVIIIVILATGIVYTINKNPNIFSFLMSSSNQEINIETYRGMIEIKNTKVDFIIAIDTDDKISNLLFLNRKSMEVLQNKKIEKSSIEDGTLKIVELLQNNNLIDNNSLVVTTLDDVSLEDEVTSKLNKAFVVYGINSKIENNKSSLQELGNKLSANLESSNDIIEYLYEYSCGIILSNVGTPTYYKESAENIYNSIETYVKNNNISNQEINAGFDIKTINALADESINLYPNINSWYYIKDGLITANISFSDNMKDYTYCISGNIDNISNGECKQ